MSSTTPQLRKPRPHRRGLVLPLVLIAVAIAMILGSCFLNSAATATSFASADENRLVARMIAESGMAMTLAYVAADPNWRTTRPNGTWVANQAMDGGTYTVLGQDGGTVDATGAVVGDGSLSNNALDPVTFTCLATYKDATYSARATLLPPGGSTLAVSERITLKDTALVDSYNPYAGAYGGTNVAKTAVISSNDIARPCVTLTGSARVNGDVYFGPGGAVATAVQVTNPAKITGTTAALPAAVAIPTVAAPTGMSASVGNVTYSSGTTFLASDLQCNDLTLTGTSILSVVGNRKILVQGNLLLNSNAAIQMASNGMFGIASAGQIGLSNSSSIDSYDSSIGAYGGTNVGSNAVIGSNATGGSSVDLNNSATLSGAAYSGVGSNPTTAITTANSSTISGVQRPLPDPLTIPAPPAWPTTVPVASQGDYSISSGTSTINTNLHVNNFNVTSSAVLKISGNVTIRADGGFTMDGTARIDLQPNSTLAIYVSSFTFTQSIKINSNTQNPSKVVIYVMGSGSSTMKNGTEVHALIDATSASVQMTQNAVLYGAIMANSVSITQTSQFHQDLNPATRLADPRFSMMATGLNIYTKGAVTILGSGLVNTTGADPTKVVFNHLTDSLIDIKGFSKVYATVIAPDATWQVSENAIYNGKATAHDLKVSGATVVNATASGGSADPGLLARETIALSGTTTLNGVGGTAIVASNSKNTIAVSVEDTAIVGGSAYDGPGGTPAADIYRAPGAQITGTTGTLPVALAFALPATPSTLPLPPNRLYNGTSTTTISANTDCANFEIADTAIVEIDGNVTLTLTGSFLIHNQAILRLKPGASLTVFASNGATITDTAQVNVGGDPSLVTINYGGTAADISLNAKVAAQIVAPSAELKVRDNAQLFGSYLGKRLKLSSAAQFHYNDCGVQRIVWKQQQ